MDTNRFDETVRSLLEDSSRRGLVGRLVSGALRLSLVRRAESVNASQHQRQKHRRRKQRRQKQRQEQPQLNEPGCIDVGQPCFGRSDLCCSGLCQGEPPNKGQPDTRTCVAHDTGGCQAGQRPDGCGGVDIACTATNGSEGACNTTTGKAGFCAFSGDCFPCAKDADCQALCGPGAACVVCAETCTATGGTACLGPDSCEGF